MTVALRPEKITLGRDEPAGGFNKLRATVKEMSYFGSFTVFQLALASGAMLKVSVANTARHSEQALTWGDVVWAHWADSAQVVLTQ